jgi:hypothetical protein
LTLDATSAKAHAVLGFYRKVYERDLRGSDEKYRRAIEINPGYAPSAMTPEHQRLEESRERKVHWKRWGPYLSARQWGTVREDYSDSGDAWTYFPHDHALSRAYRWGEDGIGGLSDRHQLICFSLSLWNERDPFLKERLFGLTNPEGNHGEDVKESYFYLDSTPTHSYMKYLYKYPQAPFPYAQLVEENRRRGRNEPEFELLDTGVFDLDRYFDVFVKYAKATAEDILVRITAFNRGPEPAALRLLPTVWFRNTWSWGKDSRRPRVSRGEHLPGIAVFELEHAGYGKRWLLCEGSPELLFTENETNFRRLFGTENRAPYVKDGINDYIVHGTREAVNPAAQGTKAAAHYELYLEPGAFATVQLRLTNETPDEDVFRAARFDDVFVKRLAEADEFYQKRTGQCTHSDVCEVQRQAFAGLLWSKQFYHYDVRTWLQGDPSGPPVSPRHRYGRNREWIHFYTDDVLCMPDKWEYPWFAAWDHAFHCVALALVDPDFAKEQLILLLREWYMHPNGQLPAYEWNFSDANPPLHAWAALRVYKIEKRLRGKADRAFLERVFHKLLLNFTWWVNRKDPDGMNVFEGGFLGLDNIGVFDRSKPLPGGAHMEQSDGTSWMALYCLNMLAMAGELGRGDQAYEDVASKFFEHFVFIVRAMNNLGGEGISLWDEQDGFFYDYLHSPDASHHAIRVRSLVGLIPLLAVTTLEPQVLSQAPGFTRRMQWFIDNQPDVKNHLDMTETCEHGPRRLLSIANRRQLQRVLRYMLDESEFLSPYGIRSLSKYHGEHPYVHVYNNTEYRVDYEPGESRTAMFGGNSNWRGPVWFPLNFLLIESLQKYDYYYGDHLKVECPTGSGRMKTLWEVAGDLSRRLTRIFLRGPDGRRPVYGSCETLQKDPLWRNLLLFYEYFHGDTGAGLGASHQTGWTALVAKLIEQSGE